MLQRTELRTIHCPIMRNTARKANGNDALHHHQDDGTDIAGYWESARGVVAMSRRERSRGAAVSCFGGNGTEGATLDGQQRALHSLLSLFAVQIVRSSAL